MTVILIRLVTTQKVKATQNSMTQNNNYEGTKEVLFFTKLIFYEGTENTNFIFSDASFFYST